MKWQIDNKEFTTPERAATEITDQMDDSYYDQMLDDTIGEIDICGHSYAASVAQFNVDETAWRVGKADYYSSLEEDLVSDLECMNHEDTETFYGIEVTAIDDELEEEDQDEEG
ncbi:MAG: hypothetical protein FWG02_03630 [Holophagaceae bacterium]|nr:hypothetical protein [Holophagaceae bacterium]